MTRRSPARASFESKLLPVQPTRIGPLELKNRVVLSPMDMYVAVDGVPVYLVQDVESSYYTSPVDQVKVHASYREEFAYLAGSIWVACANNARSRWPKKSPTSTRVVTRLGSRFSQRSIQSANGDSLPSASSPSCIAVYFSRENPRS